VVRAIIREELLKHDMEYLVREGQKLGLTIGPVYKVSQAANHPHHLARETFVEIDHPVAGRFLFPRRMVSMTLTPPVPTRAPLLGEHNAEILASLGISTEQQRGFEAAGAI
jgi:CoA:oxalate CoA-transferase